MRRRKLTEMDWLFGQTRCYVLGMVELSADVRPRSIRMPALDLLRIIAASAVVAFHWTGQKTGAFPLGYLGVELFFMISGLVIAQSIGDRTRWQFARARWRRLWPTFVTCLILTLVVAPQPVLAVLANLTMLPRIFGQPYADDVYWSLMFEIIFYAAIALLVVRHPGRLFWFGLLWLAVSLADQMEGVPSQLRTATVGEFAPYFIVGIAAYLIHQGERMGWWLWAAATFSSAMFAHAGLEVHPIRGVGWAPSVIVVVAAAAVLIAPRIRLGPKGAAVALALGGVSYPLYLLHNVFGQALPLPPALALAVVLVLCWAIWRADRWWGQRAALKAA